LFKKKVGSTTFSFDNSRGQGLEQVHYGKAFESLHASPGAQRALRALVCLGRVLCRASGLCRGGARKRCEFSPFLGFPAWCGRYEFRRFPLVVISTQTKPPRARPQAASSFLPPAVLLLTAPSGAVMGNAVFALRARLIGVRGHTCIHSLGGRARRPKGPRVSALLGPARPPEKAPLRLPWQGPARPLGYQGVRGALQGPRAPSSLPRPSRNPARPLRALLCYQAARGTLPGLCGPSLLARRSRSPQGPRKPPSVTKALAEPARPSCARLAGLPAAPARPPYALRAGGFDSPS
jgi:hypothetical protein